VPDADRPLLGELREEISGMAGEVTHLAALRWRLAEIELRESVQTAKRFSICAIVAGVLLLTSLPVFVVSLSAWLLPDLSWAWIAGLLLAIAGLAIAWFAWRRFRREFRGLEQSIEELREDLVWIKEWSGRTKQ
jgi:protein-S-isoprenylcysteine O-methyltransferase Ste14